MSDPEPRPGRAEQHDPMNASIDEFIRSIVTRSATSHDSIDESTPLQHGLQLDSLDFLALVAEIEESVGLAIPETDYPLVSTLGGLRAYLLAHSD